MSNRIIFMAAYRGTEALLGPSFPRQDQKPDRACSFRVSQVVLSRLYYPDRVFTTGTADLFPLAVRSNADAVYENAMRFLDTVCVDEPFVPVVV